MIEKEKYYSANHTTREFEALQEDFDDLKLYLDEIRNILPISVCTLSSQWVIVDINKAAEKLAGYKPLEIIGQIVDLFFKEKEKLKKIKEKAEKGEDISSKELNLISKDEKEIPVNLSIVCRKDSQKNIIGYFITITDMTEIKKYQSDLEEKVQELGKSKTALMNILEDVEEAREKTEEERNKTLTIVINFTDGLFVFDEQNKLSLINPKAEEFFDIKSRDIVGRSVSELSTFPTLNPLTKFLEKGIEDVSRKELPIKENLILELSVVPMKIKRKEVGNLVILHDITREKMIERIKTEFVSVAAHQLRTPLSAVKWTLKMITDGDLGEITKEQKEFIEKSYESNERMIGLVNDLLDVTRIEEGRYLFKLVSVNLEKMVDSIVDSYKEEIARKKISLDFKKLENKLPKTGVDVEKMRLAIQNLFDNAIKYTPPGGKIFVSLKYNRNKKEIAFSIKDTGAGIPQNQQERVFTKFFRGANVIRMETEGTGLGLFISKNIIEAHGGKIWFESEEGNGTTFYFTLPAEKELEKFIEGF